MQHNVSWGNEKWRNGFIISQIQEHALVIAHEY